jgi:hypothetical protein
MRQPITRVWTAEDDAKLRQLAAAGASKVRIAAALRRLPNSVRARAKKLGVTLKRVSSLGYDFQRRDRRRRGDGQRGDREPTAL